MSKKKYQDDFDDEIEMDDDEINDEVNDIEIDDDFDDEDDDEDDEDSNKKTSEKDIILSKHKVEGKHSLKYDSIFKGKKEDPIDENDIGDNYISNSLNNDSIEVDKSSNYHQESINNEDYIRSKLLKERVYYVLKEHTELNFMNNRRKPSRVDFNKYYGLLKKHLREESFTNVELFNELAVYFSDNLFNMFKLLDNKWRNLIIEELQEHIGKNNQSKEIRNRNIYEGTEIKFEWYDENKNEILTITGVVLETDYDNSTFKVDSYENIYTVKLHDIVEILNNTKFKYNLNRLNHIDFL